MKNLYSKIKKLTLLFIFLLTADGLSQESYSISESVKDFFETIEIYTKDYNSINKKDVINKSFSKEELKSLLLKYYKAKAEDPISFYKYQKELDKNIGESLDKDNNKELSIERKIGIIYRILSKEFGKNFMDIINVPYFLRIKILEIHQERFQSSIGLIPKTRMVVEVRETIKGKHFFNDKEIININFLNFWLSNAKKNFEINNEYFIGLIPWNCFNGDCNEIALQMFNDEEKGIYPIENNKISNINFFKISETDWKSFKNKFIQKYIITGEENE